jgi:ABC-type sugar transport system permease subunit
MSTVAKDSPLPFGRHGKSLEAREARLAWILILPTALIVFGLVVFPAIFSIWISFRDVGLKNLNNVMQAP